MKTYGGVDVIDPHFLDPGTSWRWVVSFAPLPLYLRGNSPRYPLYKRLAGPQSRSEWRGEEKLLDPTRTRTATPRPSSPYPVAIPTVLSPWINFVRWDLGYCGHYWPIVPAPDDRWWWLWSNWWNGDWQGKQKYWENLPKRHFVHHKSHVTRPGFDPGPPRWEPSD
jgi:hypothetical protein